MFDETLMIFTSNEPYCLIRHCENELLFDER